METDLQHFVNQCLDFIGCCAEVEPLKIFDLFVSIIIEPQYTVFLKFRFYFILF
jgi:hypothetical protein